MENKNKTVLIVDDIPDDRALTRMMLEKNNFSVVDAGHWADAVKAIKADDLDLIILDIQMPELDYAELLKIIRTQDLHKDIPVILYTSIAYVPFSMNEKKAYEIKGANAVIRKDDPPSVLLDKVKELLSINI